MKRLLLMMFVIAAVILPGCPSTNTPPAQVVQDACAKVMPVIAKAQTYAADAQVIIEQVRLFEALLPDPAKTSLEVALVVAEDSLTLIRSLILTASDTCADGGTLDIPTLFANFYKNWQAVEKVIADARGGGTGIKTGKPIPVPLVVQMLRTTK